MPKTPPTGPIIVKRPPRGDFGFVPLVGDDDITRALEWAVIAPPVPRTPLGAISPRVNPMALRQRKVIAAWKGDGDVMVYVPRHYSEGKATAAQLLDQQAELVENVRAYLQSGGAPRSRNAWSGQEEDQG